MRAMILAAGRGERLRPLTDTVPKPLLPVAGRALIEHLLDRLATSGFRDVVINTAHLGERIEQALGDGARFGLHLSYSREQPGALDTGGGIRQALPQLGAAPFAVVNGDLFTDFDFATLRGGLAATADAHLVLVPNPSHHQHGDFGLDAGRVLCAAPRYTFAGIGLYRPALFSAIDLQRFPLSAVLDGAIAAGRASGQLHTGAWHDVGRPATLAHLEAELG